MKKATFFQRLLAYILDMVLLGIILSVVTMGMDNDRLDKINDELMDVSSQYVDGELKPTEYLEKSNQLTYDYQKASVAINGISLALTIGYFTVFQYLNKGQTIGKKLMKIKVVSDGKQPGVGAMIIRTFIINGIISNALALVLVFVLNRNTYSTVYSGVSLVVEVIILASAFMVLYRKDRKGIHDMLAKTEVLVEGGN